MLKGNIQNSKSQLKRVVGELRLLDNLDFIFTLVYINFNCGRVVNYLKRKLGDEIQGLAEGNERMERLQEYVKAFNHVAIKPGVAFACSLEPLKEQVVTWLIEQLDDQDSKNRTLTVVPKLQDTMLSDKERLYFSTSVDVLSLMARAAKDSGLIVNKELSNVFRNISKFVRTKRAANPSGESMLNKSYRAERNVKKTAVDILHEMISKIHKY